MGSAYFLDVGCGVALKKKEEGHIFEGEYEDVPPPHH
jgi:hypothetical protein